MDYDNLSDVEDDFFDSVQTLDEDVEPVSPEENLVEDLGEAISPEPLQEFEDEITCVNFDAECKNDINADNQKSEIEGAANDKVGQDLTTGFEPNKRDAAFGDPEEVGTTDLTYSEISVDPEQRDNVSVTELSSARSITGNHSEFGTILSDNNTPATEKPHNTSADKSDSLLHATLPAVDISFSSCNVVKDATEKDEKEPTLLVTDGVSSSQCEVPKKLESDISYFATISPVSTEGTNKAKNETQSPITADTSHFAVISSVATEGIIKEQAEMLNHSSEASQLPLRQNMEKCNLEEFKNKHPHSIEQSNEEISKAITTLVVSGSVEGCQEKVKEQNEKEIEAEVIDNNDGDKFTLCQSPHSDISDTSLGIADVEDSMPDLEARSTRAITSSVLEESCPETVKSVDTSTVTEQDKGGLEGQLEDKVLKPINLDSLLLAKTVSEDLVDKQVVLVEPKPLENFCGCSNPSSESQAIESSSDKEQEHLGNKQGVDKTSDDEGNCFEPPVAKTETADTVNLERNAAIATEVQEGGKADSSPMQDEKKESVVNEKEIKNSAVCDLNDPTVNAEDREKLVVSDSDKLAGVKSEYLDVAGVEENRGKPDIQTVINDANDLEELSDIDDNEEFLLVDELCAEKEDQEAEGNEEEMPTERSFSSLGLDAESALCLELAGYNKPSKFQLKFLPPCLSGKDVIVLTDKKTMSESGALLAAFLLQTVDVSDRRAQCVVMGWSDFVLDNAQKQFKKLTGSRLSSAVVSRTSFKGVNAQVIFGSIFNLWRMGMSNCESVDAENLKTIIMYEPLVSLNGQTPTLHTAMDSVLEFVCSDVRKQQWIALSTAGLDVLQGLFHDNGRRPEVMVHEEDQVENREMRHEKETSVDLTTRKDSAPPEKLLDNDELYEALSLSEDEEFGSTLETHGSASESSEKGKQVSATEKPTETKEERVEESAVISEGVQGQRRVIVKGSSDSSAGKELSKETAIDRRSPSNLTRRGNQNERRIPEKRSESREDRGKVDSDFRRFSREKSFISPKSPERAGRGKVRIERSPIKDLDGRRLRSSRLSPRLTKNSPIRESRLSPVRRGASSERRYDTGIERGRIRTSRREPSPVRVSSRRDPSPRMRGDSRKRSRSPRRASPTRTSKAKRSSPVIDKSAISRESGKSEMSTKGKIEVVTRARSDRRFVETSTRKIGDNLIPLSVHSADTLPTLPERERRHVTEGKHSVPTLIPVNRVVEAKPIAKESVIKTEDGPPGEEISFKPKPVVISSRSRDLDSDISKKRMAPPGEEIENKRTRKASPPKEKEVISVLKPTMRTMKSNASDSSKSVKPNNIQVGLMPQTRQKLMQPILAKIEEDRKRPNKLLVSLGLEQHVLTCFTAYTKVCPFDPEPFREFLVPCLEGQDVVAEVDPGVNITSALCTILTHMLDPKCMDFQALVIAPCPVLVNHAHHQIAEFIKAINLSACCSTDYLSFDAEVTELTLGIRNQVVVGTPSRILRLLKRNLLGNRIRFVALYQLDELAADSAKTVQLEECLRFVSRERQVVATAKRLNETLVTFLRLQTRLPPLVVKLGKLSKLNVKGVPQMLTTIPTYCLNLPTWQNNLAKLILRFDSRRVLVICDHDFATLYSEALRSKGIKHTLALNRKEFLDSVEAFASFATSVVVTSVYVNTFGKMRPDLVICEGVQDVTDYYHRLESFCLGQRVTYVNLAESSDLNTYKQIEDELEYQFQVVASVNDITTI